MIISVVIPVHNEQQRLPYAMDALASHWLTAYSIHEDIDLQLIVVDNGSTDGTWKIANQYRDIITDLLYLPERGKGRALSWGISKAVGDYVYMADVDWSTPPKYIDTFLDHARRGYDLVIGSRSAPGAIVSGITPYRRLMSTVWRSAVHAAIPETRVIGDTQCGFKMLSKRLAGALQLTLSGMAWDVELIRFAVANRYAVIEIPVTWAHDTNSRVRPIHDSISMAREIISLRRSPCRMAPGKSAVQDTTK